MDRTRMQWIRLAWLVPGALMTLGSWQVTAQDAGSALQEAAKALGASITSIRYSGSGSSYSLGQNPKPDVPWPAATVKSYTASIDYTKPAMRQEFVRVQMATPPPGVPVQTIAGEQRQAQAVSGDRAWNIAGETVTPAPAAVAERVTQIWITPLGFVKAAIASGAGATAKSETIGGRAITRVSFTAAGSRRMSGVINDQHLVEKVETWVDNPVLGDMLIETTFSDYKDFNGTKFPGRIVQRQGGYPTLDVTIASVEPNATIDTSVPDAVQKAAAPTVTVDAQKIADGVWYLAGGSHHSVAVEFKDHIVVIEGPQNEERSLAVINEVKKTIPNKPIKYLVNTHHHFDHSGGIRTYAAEGAIIITHQINRRFYERTFAEPRTLNPDRYALAKTTPRFETMTEKKVLTDGSRTLELHHIKGNGHNDGLLMAYLPKEKILVEVDVYAPPAPNAPPPATPNPFSVNLYENIQRLKLDVGTIVPLHGRSMATLADLAKAIGRT
jgi:glyoxylase-like metal-dependent hydrolase (beta-lactamase superfamily II)